MPPINLEAHRAASPPDSYALECAASLEALLVVAEAARGTDAYADALEAVFLDLSDHALAELDGAEVEAVARDVIARLRAKGAK